MPEWSYMKNYKRSKKQNHHFCGMHLLVIIIYMDYWGLVKINSISNEVTVRNTYNSLPGAGENAIYTTYIPTGGFLHHCTTTYRKRPLVLWSSTLLTYSSSCHGC